MAMLATIVDWGALGQTMIASVIAGVGVAFTFSLAILGASRFSGASRQLGAFEAIAFGALAVLGLAATAAAVAFGIIVMAS